METFEKRLKRFLCTDVYEIPETLLNSINNHFLPEIRIAGQHKNTRLIFLGTHAIIQTVTENIFGLRGKPGTKFYLENFVDGATLDRKFSLISDDLHEIRNVMAHQWLSVKMHDWAANYQITEGWKLESNTLHVNPDIYLEQFLDAYGAGGRVWDYENLITKKELLIRKYYYLQDWLELGKKDPISMEIAKLKSCATFQDMQNQEAVIKQLIRQKYNIT